jgi:hypothetical protein
MKLVHSTFSTDDMRAFEPAMKIGLLATVNPQGLPHLTMISTLKAAGPDQVVWGQFTEGLSKEHVRSNPKTGFLIMSLAREVWRGKAAWTGSQTHGPDYDFYNSTPMFRYNAYFGVHTVHYMDLLAHTGRQPLPMNGIILAALKTMLARRLAPGKARAQALNAWTMAFLRKLDNLKFLAYIDGDGYPLIIPVIQAQAAGRDEVIFSAAAFGDELSEIPAGASVALLGLSLSMEDVLLRGVYGGLQRRAGILCGSLRVDWVYNCMPPAPAQIYPPLPLQPAVDF